MKTISLQNPAAFADECVKEYVANGLGSLPKKDIDLLVLRLLEKHEQFNALDNHSAAVRLGLSEAKLKSMRYELAQKFYGDEKDYFPNRLLFYLMRAKFLAAGESRNPVITFPIEDTFVRLSLAAKLKQIGGYSDWSLNSEVVRVDAEMLCEVLGGIYADKSCSAVLHRIKSKSKEMNALSFGELWKQFVTGAVRSLGAASPAYLISALKHLA